MDSSKIIIPKIINPAVNLSFSASVWWISDVPFGQEHTILQQKDSEEGLGRTWIGIDPDEGIDKLRTYLGGEPTWGSKDMTDENDTWHYSAVTVSKDGTVNLYLDGEL